MKHNKESEKNILICVFCRSCVLQGCGKDCFLWLHYSGAWKPEASLPREDNGGMARPQVCS